MSPQPPRRSTRSLFLLVVSLILLLLFLVAHLAGWRAQTSVLSGVHPGSVGQQIQGLCYAGLYVLAVMVAPVLAIAALILKGWVMASRRARR